MREEAARPRHLHQQRHYEVRRLVTTSRTRREGRADALSHSTPRGPIRRDEWVRRVREALHADYIARGTSPLCDLPGVLALARSDCSRRIYPTAAAVRALLDRAYDAALLELDGVADRRMRQVATYLT